MFLGETWPEFSLFWGWHKAAPRSGLCAQPASNLLCSPRAVLELEQVWNLLFWGCFGELEQPGQRWIAALSDNQHKRERLPLCVPEVLCELLILPAWNYFKRIDWTGLYGKSSSKTAVNTLLSIDFILNKDIFLYCFILNAGEPRKFDPKFRGPIHNR